MKLPLISLPSIILVAFVSSTFAAPQSSKVRTISDVSSIPHRVLKRSISPKFYKSLLQSPIEGLVIVRGKIDVTARISGARVIHSELGGRYDSLALERAQAMTISGYYATDKLNKAGNVLVNLLIYKTADGTAALSFAQLDEPGGDQQDYYGCALLAVLKSDGKWTEIKSVDSLQGKGMVLRTNKNSAYAMREVFFFAGLNKIEDTESLNERLLLSGISTKRLLARARSSPRTA